MVDAQLAECPVAAPRFLPCLPDAIPQAISHPTVQLFELLVAGGVGYSDRFDPTIPIWSDPLIPEV